MCVDRLSLTSIAMYIRSRFRSRLAALVVCCDSAIDNEQSIDMPAKRKAEAGAGAAAAGPATVWPAMPSQARPSASDPDIVSRISSPEAFGGVCDAANFIVERLRSSNLASEIKLAPKNLGLHPSNRGSYGCHEDISRKQKTQSTFMHMLDM